MFKKTNLLVSGVLVMIFGVTGVQTLCAQSPARTAYRGTTLNLALKVGYETAGIKDFIDVFEKETGIKVKYEVYDEPTLRKKFILDAAARTGAYDITTVQFWYFPEYDRAGYLEPLDRYIDEKRDPWLDLKAIPESLRALFTAKNEWLYGLPQGGAGGLLMYRKDIFEKHGLQFPSTVADVVRAAPKLKDLESELYPWIGRGDASFASFGTSAGWAWAYGARVLDEKNRVTINTPEMQQAMRDFITLMKDYGPPGQSNIGWRIMGEMMRGDRGVMSFDMSGFPATLENPEISKITGKCGYSLIKGPAQNYAQWIYSEALGINKYSKKKDAAWLLLQWRVSLDTYLREVKAHIRFDMPNTAVYETDTYKEEAKKLNVETFTSAIGAILGAIDRRYWPWVPEFTRIAEAFQKEISLAIAGSQTVDQALAKAQSEVSNIATEAGYQ